ncbi:MAG: hypothetical protein OER12_03595, partial [Acidimicrobiia bacterium]|nr:hypothetical protein [Acidimicrobiia bacterium]
MFDTIEQGMAITSTADLLKEIRREERKISRHRARQVRLLRELQSRYLRTPSPSAASLAAELDMSTETTRALLETATRTPEQSDRMAQLESGEWTFDR